VHRALRVARTIVDLELADKEKETGPIGPVHLAEALQLRRAID
jgi:predicted ATPase with chaperone activity